MPSLRRESKRPRLDTEASDGYIPRMGWPAAAAITSSVLIVWGPAPWAGWLVLAVSAAAALAGSALDERHRTNRLKVDLAASNNQAAIAIAMDRLCDMPAEEVTQ